MDPMHPFTDPAAVANYADDTPRKVPGFADLHRMTLLLLAERAPQTLTSWSSVAERRA